MKSITPIIFFMFILINSMFCQTDFKVIKVNGTILQKTKGTSLETGTVFSDKEELVFRSEDATAAVINSQVGRLVLTSKNHDLASARSNYLPAMYNISSRSISISDNSDLSSLFSGKYVVLERQSIEIDDKAFPMNNDHFFFLRYVFNGEDINKKLDYSGDTLIIERKNLFTVDGKPIPSADNTSIKLFYRKGTESVSISEFDLIFPDMNQLKKEVKVILDEIKGKPVKEKIGEIGSYINENYGKVRSENLTTWLKSNFGLKTD
ncbi:MAG TPA: hypothetical protein VIK07_09700 [Bacteroidales bacterium]